MVLLESRGTNKSFRKLRWQEYRYSNKEAFLVGVNLWFLIGVVAIYYLLLLTMEAWSNHWGGTIHSFCEHKAFILKHSKPVTDLIIFLMVFQFQSSWCWISDRFPWQIMVSTRSNNRPGNNWTNWYMASLQIDIITEWVTELMSIHRLRSISRHALSM